MASYFERYKGDATNYSLFLWGSAMPMIEYYETNGMILSSEEPEFYDSRIGEITFDDELWTLLGESGVYPKYVKWNIGLQYGAPNHWAYYLIPEEGADLFEIFSSNPGEFCIEKRGSGVPTEVIKIWRYDSSSWGDQVLYDANCQPLAVLDGPM